jgi:hypothetical protein
MPTLMYHSVVPSEFPGTSTREGPVGFERFRVERLDAASTLVVSLLGTSVSRGGCLGAQKP